MMRITKPNKDVLYNLIKELFEASGKPIPLSEIELSGQVMDDLRYSLAILQSEGRVKSYLVRENLDGWRQRVYVPIQRDTQGRRLYEWIKYVHSMKAH